jgi:hypothetical protein
MSATTMSETARLLKAPKKDLDWLNGLVDTLTTLVDDFMLFSKLRQSRGVVSSPIILQLLSLLTPRIVLYEPFLL